MLIQHDYNDTEETGTGGISTVSEMDVSCYYYREVDESNDIDMSITVKYRSQFVIFIIPVSCRYGLRIITCIC